MTELDKLEEWLHKHGFDYKRIDREPEQVEFDGRMIPTSMGRHQIIVYGDNGIMFDAICHIGSYGYEQGLLELMGDIVQVNDTVEGWLTADDIIERLK
jgi:predicted fused transcriptional regulator/phosphomethylpyrimidine kinase